MLLFYDPVSRLLGFGSYQRALVEQARVRPGGSVLEIGCGTGNLTLLAKRMHPAANVVGLDPDPAALARARRKAARKGLSVGLDLGFAQELPYPDAWFDLVLSAFMFHHLGPDEKRGSLREARRVLKPGGSLHMLDFGEGQASPGGFFLHRPRRRGRTDHRSESVTALMRGAGFDEPAEVAHQAAGVMGSMTYYRADAPIAGEAS